MVGFKWPWKRKDEKNKKELIRKAISDLSPRTEFGHAMSFVKEAIELEKTYEDRILMLEYVLEIVKQDIKHDLLTTMLYDGEHFEKRMFSFFPSDYYDEHGRRMETYPEEYGEAEKIVVDLATKDILVLPWHRERRRSTLKFIKKDDFVFIRTNHKGYYYTHIDLCHVWNGLHSISAGVYHKKGFIEVPKIDISKLFKHIHTDGEHWYNSHTGKQRIDLWDFRIGIIYEVAKLKYVIENKENIVGKKDS